jgi:hypothetical protein
MSSPKKSILDYLYNREYGSDESSDDEDFNANDGKSNNKVT